MTPQELLLDHGRKLLSAARRDASSWDRFRPRIEDGADGRRQDAHERDRLQLAWALQYDRGDGDAALVRFVLEQEAAWREVSPSSGLGETLELTGWLVARDRRVEDVWSLARVKWANFDAGAGFDREHLVSAGVAATLAYVQRSEHAHQPRLRQLLQLLLDEQGQPTCSEDEVTAWHQAKAQWFAVAPADEPLQLWIERALAIGDRVTAKALARRWNDGCERSEDDLATLATYLLELGEYQEEAAVRLTRLGLMGDRFARAGELCRIARAERRALRWRHALEHLEQAGMMHRVRLAWRELGLGRDLVDEAFELAAESSAEQPERSADVARRAFTLGDELAAQTPRLPPLTLEHAVRAAKALGESEKAERYQAQLHAATAG